MKNICKKCGHEIDDNAPICMYCGTSISESDINQETKSRMEIIANKKEPTGGTKIKAVGAGLLIIGFIADIVSMFLIISNDFSIFNGLTIFGTIIFLIGITLIRNS